MKSYILWDHDGVLVDTEPWYYEATRRHILQLGVELQLDDYLADRITEAEFLAHQIKGAGGSLGFADVNDAATRLDDHLKTLVAHGRDAAAAQMERVRGLFEDLRRTAEATTPESSSLWNTKPPRFSARFG